MNRHFIIPEKRLFTDEGWQTYIEPMLDKMDRRGGAVVVVLEATPMFENYVTSHVAVFNDQERKVIRRAIQRQREKAKQEAQQS